MAITITSRAEAFEVLEAAVKWLKEHEESPKGESSTRILASEKEDDE